MSSTAVTTSTRFISQALEDLYAGGAQSGTAFSLTALGSSLASFRGDATGQTQNQAIATVDATIQTFETANVPTTSAAGTTAQSYPVDQAGILQQLMAQVFAQLIEAGSPPGSTYGASNTGPSDPVTSSGFVNDSSLPDNFSQLDFNPNDYNAGSTTNVNATAYFFLNTAGQNILSTYYNLIQGAFAEGALTTSNPFDPTAIGLTGVSLTASSTTLTCASTAGISAGAQISGAGIPSGTTVSSVISGTQLQLSQAASSAQSGSTASVNIEINLTGVSLTANSTTLTCASTAGIAAGAEITGAGIPIGTTVSSVISGTQLQLSQAATSAESGSTASANNTVVSANVTSIPPQVIDGVTYGYVTAFANNSTNPPTFQSYLVPTGIVLQAVAKQALDNAQYAPGDTAASQIGYQVTFVNAAQPASVTMIPVDSTSFQPTGGAAVTMSNVRFMDAITYTYYWNEARVAVMKGELNYQQDVVQLLQNALTAANNASTDLTQQSGLTEQQNSSGAPDPNASPETASLNMFVAIVSTPDNMLFSSMYANPSTGNTSSGANPFYFNYTEWQANQVALKNYTDNLNSQAQNAMLDYQQTLNNYNNGYQVMGQLQDKFNTMFQSQLQNFLSTTS